MPPTLFKIVDSDTGNTVGFYVDEAEAEARFRHMVTEGPDGDSLVLVRMAEDGAPLNARSARDLLKSLRKPAGRGRKATARTGKKKSSSRRRVAAGKRRK